MAIPFYNEKQKKEYVIQEQQNAVSLRGYFRRVAEKEYEYQKDLAEMDEAELRDTFASLRIRRVETLSNMLSLMRGYVRWARFTKRISGSSPIDSIVPVSLVVEETVASQMVKSPEHFNEIVEKGVEAEIGYKNNRINLTRLVMWLLYSGLEIAQLRTLKKTDIDYENKTVLGTPVFDKVVPLWDTCKVITSIEKHGTRAREGTIEYKLLENDNMFRPIAGNKSDPHALLNGSHFHAIVSNVAKEYKNIRLTALTIKNSGIFYRLLEQEKAGSEKLLVNIAKWYNIEYADDSELAVKTRKWRIDYEEWKIAFGHM